MLGCADDSVPTLPDSNIIIGTGDGGRDAGSEDGTVSPDAGRDASSDDSGAADTGEVDSGQPDGSDGGPRPADGGDPCAAPAVTEVTVEEVHARETELLGEVITVIGTTTVSVLTCTGVPCDITNPCCNTCTATVSFVGGLGIASSACFERPGCRGTECGVICRPPVLGNEGRYRGVLNRGPVLELLSVEP